MEFREGAFDFQTSQQNLTIRFSEEKDVKLILEFIRELTRYENLENEVTATEKTSTNS